MSWHKLNLALIAVLILIDTFLGFTLYNTYKKVKILPDDMITEARENLSHAGIGFDTDTIDRKYHTRIVYKYTASEAYAEEMKQNAKKTHPCLLTALEVLSSQSSDELADSIQYFDVPDGTSVSVSGKLHATAKITGKTDFEYSEDSFSSPVVVTKIRENLAQSFYPTETPQTPDIVSDFFDSVYGGKIGARCILSEQLDGGMLYTCLLTVDGDMINGMPACFFVRDERIVHLKGNLFFSIPEDEYETKIIDGVNILYNLKDSVSSPVDVMSQHHEYATLEHDNGSVYVFPVWKIAVRCSDGTLDFPIFNALTGERLT